MKKHIPNIITCCNLICGCIATYCGFKQGYDFAFLFILLGAFFDFFDGMTARALGVSGKMGLELDSLADCVTFGVAPSSILFTLFFHVQYPEILDALVVRQVMPFTAFLIAAFSALRLAKFNIDERQHFGFIGMPTPANAIFWASLVCSSKEWLVGPRFNVVFLFLFMILFCWLLVCEVPMFAFKFKTMSWAENKVKYIFLMICFVVLCSSAVVGGANGMLWYCLIRALSVCIGLYVLVSIVASYLPKRD